MPIFQSGGGQVGSSQITDGSIVNADINSAAAIAQSKLAGGADTVADVAFIETTAGTTHSLTTVAGQRVLVFAFGNLNDGGGAARTIALNYNGVAQHSVTITSGAAATNTSFALCYKATHGAATQNVTVTTTGGTLQNVVIMVIKLK